MKRHPALQDLSRDHFFVLVRCQRVRKAAADGAPPEAVLGLARDFLDFFDSDMRAHFREEDEFVVPEAERRGDAALRAVAHEIHEDHTWLAAAFADLRTVVDGGRDPLPLLRGIEARLTRHVRFEEERLFEGVQAVLSEDELQAMWRRSYAFRRVHRADKACTVPPPTGLR